MKKNILLTLSLVILLSSCDKSDNPQNIALPPTTSCLPANLQNGLLAFYSFGNGSLNDQSGNGHDLSNPTTASPGPDRNGSLGCAFSFNKLNGEYLETANSNFLNDLPSTGMSISFWYKANNDDSGVFISRGDNVICDFTTGQWSVNYLNATLTFGVNGLVAVRNIILQQNVWEHVVITSTASNLQMYRNGVLADYGTITCTQTNPTSNIGNLFIGKSYDGTIDDVVIYNRVVTAFEVTQLYNLAACCN